MVEQKAVAMIEQGAPIFKLSAGRLLVVLKGEEEEEQGGEGGEGNCAQNAHLNVWSLFLFLQL